MLFNLYLQVLLWIFEELLLKFIVLESVIAN